MNHSVTVGGLLMALGVLATVILAVCVLLYAFAKGMSDAP